MLYPLADEGDLKTRNHEEVKEKAKNERGMEYEERDRRCVQGRLRTGGTAIPIHSLSPFRLSRSGRAATGRSTISGLSKSTERISMDGGRAVWPLKR